MGCHLPSEMKTIKQIREMKRNPVKYPIYLLALLFDYSPTGGVAYCRNCRGYEYW
jgi:hypothetical protein